MICFYEFKHWDEGIYYLAYGYYYDELPQREAIPTILTKVFTKVPSHTRYLM